MISCEVCGKSVHESRHGKARRFCGEKCRSRFRRGLREVGESETVPTDDLKLSHLHFEAQNWVKAVTTGREMMPTELQLVLEAGQALSNACKAREVLREEDLVVATPQGIKSHPAVSIERQASALFLRICKAIAKDANQQKVKEPQKSGVLNGQWKAG